MENYLVAMLVFAGVYALLALGLNVVWGMAGMINLGLVGFFGLGAYVAALLARRAGWPMAAGLPAAALVAAGAGALVALVTARLRGDYLAIVTLGFSEVVRVTASNEIWLTNGTDGISGIPGPWRGQVSPAAFNLIYLGLVAAAVVVVVVALERVRHSPYGRVLRAIRDDDQVAAVAGKPVRAFKVEAFALSAAILGLAGALYAHYTSYIAPEAFAPLISIYIVLALTAGGTGNNHGAVLGAALVVFFMESTRFVTGTLPGLSAVQAAAVREMLIGASLILVLRVRPAGLVPERIRPVPVR
ncbi:MAG TPA: branched-chain amino acid ABC transporter permease [Methylomirabilota bacterium]|jgi:branched-chain amino acid transport system permease protein|nr:branched-chain amino acid ABC transporter permease [Methylomirabilota bacterium]